MFSVVAIALAAAVQAKANATTTVEETVLTTYCPGPTTFAWGNSTYTVTEPTTLTITDCECTEKHNTTTPTEAPVVGAGNAAGVAGVAGVAAAVAYLL